MNPEWILDKFEENWEHEERLKDLKPLGPSKKKKQSEKLMRHREENRRRLMEWNPFEDLNISSDPFKTLYVGRLNYDTTEKKLRKEFEAYGPIKQIRMIKRGEKFAGYAFIGSPLEFLQVG
jgi:U1 small nuclear ribonucleoprotein